LGPRRVLVVHEVLNQLGVIVILLLMVVSAANGHKADVPLRNLDSLWLWLIQSHLENQITFFVGILALFFFLLLLVEYFISGNLVNFLDFEID
jgi:hypothetical protein